MPVMTLETAKLTQKQKKALVQELVPLFAKIINMPEETIYTFIKENEGDNVGVGQNLLSEMRSNDKKNNGDPLKGHRSFL